jgi:hypothetical protein
MALTFLVFTPAQGRAQAALLMEQPYGFFGSINPTGHNAIYFERICAETPVKLRRCQAGELGAVVSRYQGISGYDWVAIPLLPYLYAVENPADVPTRVNRETVNRMRSRYHEAHLLSLGVKLRPGNLVHGGWAQLVGMSYERRIYAFRFETTEAQDDALIARLNSGSNRTQFNLLFNNCSDFARFTLNSYFPKTFHRSTFPDAGMTTPQQLAYKLEHYAALHPETQLTIFEIPQIPGYRRMSRSNKSVAQSLSTTGYAIPIALASPYLAGGLFVDSIVRAHHHLIPKNPQLLSPDNLSALTAPARIAQNPMSADAQAPSASSGGSENNTEPSVRANSGLKEIRDEHE